MGLIHLRARSLRSAQQRKCAAVTLVLERTYRPRSPGKRPGEREEVDVAPVDAPLLSRRTDTRE